MPIRLAQSEDLEQIVAIYNASIPGRMATADTLPIAVESRAKWFHAHEPSSRPLWVAQEEGKVTGYLGLRNFYGRPAYRITAEVAVYVHPEAHRRGIASGLLRHCLEHSPRLGLENLLAFVFAHNTPSVRLFERFGFERWGYLPAVADLDGRRVDLMIMGRKVGDQ